MRIVWNEVTWYSKILAMVLFVALPFLGFWGGILYEQATSQNEVIKETAPVTQPSENGTVNTGNNLPGKELPKVISARTILSFEPNKSFQLQNLPNVTFRLQKISRAFGGIEVSSCGPGNFIYIPDPSGRSGSCISESKLRIDGNPAGLTILELKVENNSKAYVSSRFLQLFYNPETGDEIQSRLAEAMPSVDGYGALPQSNRIVRIGFLTPQNQEQAQLVYGDYGKSNGLPESQETLLGKSTGGRIIDFKAKILADIPG